MAYFIATGLRGKTKPTPTISSKTGPKASGGGLFGLRSVRFRAGQQAIAFGGHVAAWLHAGRFEARSVEAAPEPLWVVHVDSM